MTMLTALRELLKPKYVRVYKEPGCFRFDCYDTTVYLSERLVYMRGAEAVAQQAWATMNEPDDD